MRNYQKASILLAISIFAAGLTGCADSVTSLTGKVETSVIGEGSGSGELTREKKSFNGSEFDTIHVNARAMEIYVTKGSGDLAEVELVRDKAIENRFTFDVSVQSGELNVNVEEDTKSFNFPAKGQKGERKLLISLPDKIYDQVTIKNEFGIVEAADVKAGNVDIMLDAGEIRLNKVSGKMQLETDAGEIEVQGISLENDLSARTDVGEINIHLNESPKAAIVDLKSGLGEVTADLEDVQYSVSSTNEKVGTIGSNGARLEAYTSVGAILVNTK